MERVAIAHLNIAHTHLLLAAPVAGVKASQIPPLEDFIPDDTVHEPALQQPLTFEDWARAIMPPPMGG